MRTLSLMVWAVPYAARWTLSKVGIRVAIPPEGEACNKSEEALQQFFAVGLLTLALCAFIDPDIGMAVGGVLAVVKLYNLWRIKLN